MTNQKVSDIVGQIFQTDYFPRHCQWEQFATSVWSSPAQHAKNPEITLL